MNKTSAGIQAAPGDLAPKSIYLCGPIDLGTDIKWKEILKSKLAAANINITMFDPATAFKLSSLEFDSGMAKFIEDVNTQALLFADLVVCSLPLGVQSVGTIIELDLAAKSNKDIIILSNIKYNKSAYLVNRIDQANWVFISDIGSEDVVDDALNDITARIVSKSFGGKQ